MESRQVYSSVFYVEADCTLSQLVTALKEEHEQIPDEYKHRATVQNPDTMVFNFSWKVPVTEEELKAREEEMAKKKEATERELLAELLVKYPDAV